MALRVNNQNDIFADNVYLLNTTSSIYQEVRDLINSGSGGGGTTTQFITSALTPLTVNNQVLSIGAYPNAGISIFAPNNTTVVNLTVGNNGEFYINGDELVELNYLLNTYAPSQLRLTASNNITRNLTPELDGSLSYDSNTLITSPVLTGILNSYYTKSYIDTTFNNYTTTTDLTTLLNAKQDTLTAGANITISNNVISSSVGGTNLILQVDGTTKTATTLNFENNDFTLSNNVLTIKKYNDYDNIIFKDSSNVSRTLEPNTSSKLLYNNVELIDNTTLTNTLNNYTDTTNLTTLLNAKQDIISVNLPLEKVNNTISTKWKPSSIFSSDTFFTFNDNDATGSLSIVANPNNLTFDNVVVRSPAGTTRNITGDNNSNLLYNSNILATQSYVNNQITSNANTATLPIQIVNGDIQTVFKPSVITSDNTINLSSVNDSTGAINFGLNPSNIIYSVVKINDGTTTRDLISNQAGNLLYNNNEIAFRANTYTSITTSAPLSSSFTSNNGLSLSISSLFKPSTISSNTLTLTPSDINGTLSIDTNDDHEFTNVKIKNSSNSVLNLTHDIYNKLLWNNDQLETIDNVYRTITTNAPLSSTTTNNLGYKEITIQTLFKPSSVSVGVGLSKSVSNDSTGLLSIVRNDNYEYVDLKLTNTTTNAVKSLTLDSNNKLLFDGVDISTPTPQLTTNAPFSITNNVLSSSWVPSSISVGSGMLLIHSNSLGTASISLTGTENRTQINLIDSGNSVRILTSDTNGNLIWDGSTIQKELTFDLPLQINSSTGNLESLFKPSNVSFSSQFIKSFSDALGVLSVSLQPNLQVDSIVFYNSTNNVYKNLLVDNNNKLVYDSDEVQLVKNSFGQFNCALPLTISSSTLSNGSTSITLDTLWKPSSINVSSSSGLLNVHNDTTGQTTLTLTDTYAFTDLKLKDSGNTIRSFNASTNGDLIYNNLVHKDFTFLQTNYLNAVANMVDGTSPISLGSGQTSGTHKIAVYENTSSSYTLGSFYYGISLWLGTAQGLGLYATGTKLPRTLSSQSTTTHEDPILIATQTTRRIGINTLTPSYDLEVGGDAMIQGNLGCGTLNANTINATTKNFLISHPNPTKAKENYMLRHWCIETDTQGGSCYYTKKINCKEGENIILMSDYFEYLLDDIIIFCSPFKHFGQAWGEQDETDKNKIIIHCNQEGDYNILITGSRKDKDALNCDNQVEFIKEEKEDNNECSCIPNPT